MIASRFLALPLRSLLAAVWLLCAGIRAFAASENVGAPAFSSDTKGNIFTDTTGSLILRLPGGVSGGEITVRDESGRVSQTLPIPAGAAGAFPVSLSGKGYYTLAAVVKLADGSAAKAAATAAVVGPVPPDELRLQSRLGLWTVQGDPDLVLAAGARWNRRMVSIHTLGQDLLGPNPPPAGKILFPPTPFTQVGVISFGLPLWLMEPTPSKKHFGNPLAKPTDWATLKVLVSAWVRQQGDNFPDHFEIYNEPEWQWKGSNEDLVRFLATLADGIKEARPQTKVLGPGFSSIRIKDPARLDLVTAEKMGLFNHLDGIVVHAYVDGTAPEGEFIGRVIELRDYLKEIGRPDFPIHLTEFGWTSAAGTWQKPVDEITQARYAVRSLTLLAALGVENATYFCLQFKAAPNPGERGFSLLREDSTPKPSYAAYANVARWLAGVRGLGTWLHLTPTTHLILFEKTTGASIAVAWDTAASRAIELPLKTIRREDMMGRTLAGSDRLELSPSPIFLEFPEGRSPSLKMLPGLSVMRGGEAVKLPTAGAWIAPAPLHVADGILSAPQDAANGDYLLLARADDHWLAQPVQVIPPMEASVPVLQWPADQASPTLATTLISHARVPVTTRVAASLDGLRDEFLEPAPVQAGETRALKLSLPDLVPGRRYRGQLTVDSRYQGRRDEIVRPLDLTLIAATHVPAGRTPDWSQQTPVDFSTWDPLGGPIAAEDCSAALQSACGDDGLHLRVVVRDDEHLQTRSAEDMWTQDSIQIGLDPDVQKTWEANDLFGLKGHRVFEYGLGWDGSPADRPMTWRWVSYLPDLPVGVAEPRIRLKVSRDGDLTTYDALFPWQVLGLDHAPSKGSAIGIALAVTDADTGKKGRRVLRLFNGVTDGKDPEKFGPLWLR